MKKARSIIEKKIIACVLLFLFFPALTWAWQGRVVGVTDGDTLTVMHRGCGEKIRLYGVDAPEKGQDFGRKAKQFASDLVFGKTVEVLAMDKDRYGRTVAKIYTKDGCLNEELIKAGLAWVYRKYCKTSECSKWLSLEENARFAKKGLWSIKGATPPWEFRKRKNNSNRDSANSGQQGRVVYHGNISSKVFHRPSCKNYNCKNCTAEFASKEAALAAGFRPCGVCKP